MKGRLIAGCLHSEIFLYSNGIRKFFRMPRLMDRLIILEFYVVEKYIWQLAFIGTSRVCTNSGYITLGG